MAQGEGKVGSLPFVGKRGTSAPTGGGWENLPMTERLRQTFERGVTRVELDLADAYNKKIMPGHIPEAQKRISRQIAKEFGGTYSVHAPYQVDFTSQSWGQRIEAAEIMRQSIKYAKEMGAKYVTFHPTANLSGASFFDPFTWQSTPVPAHIMMRDKQEFDNWCKVNHVEEGSPIYEKLRTEAGIMFNAQSMQFTQHYAASAPIFAREFGRVGSSADGFAALAKAVSKGITNVADLRGEYVKATKSYTESLDEDVRKGANEQVVAFLDRLEKDPKNMINNLKDAAESAKISFEEMKSKNEKDPLIKDPFDVLKADKNDYWQKATMARGGRLNNDGSTIQEKHEYEGIGDPSHDLFLAPRSMFDSEEEWNNYLKRMQDPNKSATQREDMARRHNFAMAMTLRRQIDLGEHDPKATGLWIDNLKQTFEDVFKNRGVQEDLKSGEIVISVENLWGVNPEKGVTDAAGYFNKADHMIKAVEAMREVAKKHGINPEHVKMTFDTEHAAIGTQQTPDEFINEMKKQGKEEMIGHVHLVGGGSTASVFGHKGFGSIEDDVARKNPELLKKLVEMGVPLTIEPGSGGIKDVEAGLETLLLGAPMDALQAANTPGIKGGAEEALIRQMGYLGTPTPAYGGVPSGSGYFAAFAAQNASMIGKSLYSFGPSLAQPFRATYSALASPSLYQGGISHQMPGTNIWGGSQPMVYSMKQKE